MSSGAEPAKQVVMPEKYHSLVLKSYCGDVPALVHFGVKNSYQLLLKHFNWAQVKKNVARFVKSYHVSQIAGKLNTSVKTAMLYPIPLVRRPLVTLLIG